MDPEGFEREVDILRALRDEAGDTARVPRLAGTVGLAEGIPGIVTKWIDHEASLYHTSVKNVSETTRRNWLGQIQGTLDLMHLKGLVWGSAKAENVLIDNDQNAWVIDFGGEYTEGWVEKNVMESVEGDTQGLLKIQDFLSSA
ncbi:hypothetical protein BDW69DRAFT_126932 [Aspergillus filifer]